MNIYSRIYEYAINNFVNNYEHSVTMAFSRAQNDFLIFTSI